MEDLTIFCVLLLTYLTVVSSCRQWYTFAVSGPRKVVVLLDISFDLVRADRAALRNASINLLRSLNSKDQVSVHLSMVTRGRALATESNAYSYY